MREFFPHAMVENADYLVTFNVKDFVLVSGDAHKIAVTGPSTSLTRLTILDRLVVEQRLGEQAAAIGIGVSDLLNRLEASVPGFVLRLRVPT
jgi:hypothetical protein